MSYLPYILSGFAYRLVLSSSCLLPSSHQSKARGNLFFVHTVLCRLNGVYWWGCVWCTNDSLCVCVNLVWSEGYGACARVSTAVNKTEGACFFPPLSLLVPGLNYVLYCEKISENILLLTFQCILSLVWLFTGNSESFKGSVKTRQAWKGNSQPATHRSGLSETK